MAHDHDDHDHDHDHGQELPSEMALRVKALKSLLVEKGLVDPAALDAIVETYENKVGPRNGARVVARAWTDPGLQGAADGRRHRRDRRARLSGAQGEHMVVGGEHAGRPQPRRLHAVLLLSVAGAGPAAGLVQVLRLPLARRDRSARRAGASSACRCPTTSRCGCGIPPRRSATSCCPSGLPAPTA